MVIELLKKTALKLSGFIYAIPNKICYFLELQLFITILALPIFLTWGLPISLLSPIGNLIFGPWLTAFLTLSSLLFFLQIVCIENSFIIYLLENLNQLFFYLLDLGNRSFMVSCPCPSKLFLVLIPFTLFFIIKIRSSSNIYLRVLTLFIFTTFIFLMCKHVLAPHALFQEFINKNQKILLIKQFKKNTLTDLGALSEGRNPLGWVKYQFVPELLKLGIDHLDCLVIPKPSSKTFESIIELSKNIPIKHLYLQEWIGRIPYTGRKNWKALLDLKKQKKLIISLLTSDLTITLHKRFLITIKMQNYFTKKGPLKYKGLQIEANLDGRSINLTDFQGNSSNFHQP